MNGPDALAGVRRGGRPTLAGTSTETAATADRDTAADVVPGTAGADHPAAQGAARRGQGGRGRRARPSPERAAKRAERDAGRPARLSLSNWPVSTRLAALFVVASVTGLVFGGLRIAGAASEATGYNHLSVRAACAILLDRLRGLDR